MPELMPIFMDTLSEGDPHVREGVCIGLAELINATTKETNILLSLSENRWFFK